MGEFCLRLEEEPLADEVIAALRRALSLKPWREVVFCGFGEPTVRLDTLLEVAGWIRANTSIPMRLDTNGHVLLLYSERNVVAELKKAGVVRVSVSLNADNKAVYDEICRPKLEGAFEKVIEFIERARDAGLEVEATAVAIPEVEVSRVKRLAQALGVKFRARPCRTVVW